MLKGNVKLTGSLAIALNGVVVREVKNRVVLDGLEHITQRLLATAGQNAMSHMAVGTDSTTAVPADDALGQATGTLEKGRVPMSGETGSVSASEPQEITFVGEFGAGTGTGELTEAGLFNASSAGDMLARTTFGSVDKGADDTMTITWTITASAG